MLGYPDSNQERQDQNLQCYHYTIPQCPCIRGNVVVRFLIAGAKVELLSESTKYFCNFFMEKFKKAQKQSQIVLCYLLSSLNYH